MIMSISNLNFRSKLSVHFLSMIILPSTTMGYSANKKKHGVINGIVLILGGILKVYKASSPVINNGS